ncbi:MAG: AAA domain-containing protein [Mucilaginibacter sp.]
MKKEKYLQIFNYLLEFSKLRSNPVRDINNSSSYEPAIWVVDLPKHDSVKCASDETSNTVDDCLLSLTKQTPPKKPSFPVLSANLQTWVDESSLINSESKPILKQTALIEEDEVLIEDHPEITEEFEAYLSSSWETDSKLYKQQLAIYEEQNQEFKKLNNLYNQFFTIYNKVQQFGEEYELILALGYLNFRENENSPLISRHILTLKVDILFEFNSSESLIKVVAPADGEVRFEPDAFIDLQEIFEAANVIEAENLAKDYLSTKDVVNFLKDKNVLDCCRIFASRFHSEGAFFDNLERPEISTKPTISYSPAFILRKRNTRSFSALYEKIIKSIGGAESDLDIDSINDLISAGFQQEDGQSAVDFSQSDFDDEIIYFPKKYNEEQIKIVRKAKASNKVLAQGPPGTGKSHTIANIICHLLANGKRVLITAYTKRALEVLKQQLPDEFQKLTVNLLSGDSDSIKDLEASVNSISDEFSKGNRDFHTARTNELLSELSDANKKIARLTNEWLLVNESSTRKAFINSFYEGSLLEIAEKLELDSKALNWFQDDYSDLNRLNIVEQVTTFFQQTSYYQNEDLSLLVLEIPEKSKLISASDFLEYLNIKDEITKRYPHKGVEHFVECNSYDKLLNLLSRLLESTIEIEACQLSFKNVLEKDIITNLPFWADKLSRTSTILNELSTERLKKFDEDVEIIYPSNRSIKVLKNDAQILVNLINEGKRVSGVFSIFNNPLSGADLKSKKYFLDEVRVNNNRCDNIENLNLFLESLQIKQSFDNLEQLWSEVIKPSLTSLYDKFFFYNNLRNEVEKLISNIEAAKNIATDIQISSLLKINVSDSNSLKEQIENIEFSNLAKSISGFESRLENTQTILNNQYFHPFCRTLLNDLKQNNWHKYEVGLQELENLRIKKEEYKSYCLLKNELRNDLPLLVQLIVNDNLSDDHLKILPKAIHFRHAQQTLKKMLSKDYQANILVDITDAEGSKDKIVSQLAAHKAWSSVLQRLAEKRNLRQHLEAWVLSVSKIGKTGTGKKAIKFRREAQRQMEQCKDSIPCWIMPLYKVAETINPEVGMFDYVIVDEASQLGPDAIFLLYITKNIIIVGDDKQTSPEYIGVDANAMSAHIFRHLKDIPFANYYGTEFSFFDHAKIFCNGLTILREHYRCMPEIIEFCNKHFYAKNNIGLYPLKQYSENRLEPLKAVFCETGFTEGTHTNIINREEAELIVSKIADLVKDDAYKNKTIGVIGLQGSRQSSIIENSLINKIGELEFHKRKIICGTSSSFQGDERDIMFLSLTTAHNHNRMPLTKPEDERRFNVAMSRAKEQVWLFHSVQLEDLKAKSKDVVDLRYSLLNHFQNYKENRTILNKKVERKIGQQPEPFESWFEVDVYNDISGRGFEVIPQYKVANGRYRIDLVVILGNGTKIAIECDGDKFHGPEHYAADLNRQKVLERCGWQFYRIRGADYYSNRITAIEPLWPILENNEAQKSKVGV